MIKLQICDSEKVLVTLCINDEIIQLISGDCIDLGSHGLLVFYKEPEATAIRTLQEESRKRVRDAIEFTKKKYKVKDDC